MKDVFLANYDTFDRGRLKKIMKGRSCTTRDHAYTPQTCEGSYIHKKICLGQIVQAHKKGWV